MTNIRPTISSSISGQKQAQSSNAISVQITGQKTSSGTATPKSLIENITSINELYTYAGRDSHLAKMGRGIFSAWGRSQNVRPVLDIIALDDNGTTYATEDIVFSGTSTATKIINVYADSYTLTLPFSNTKIYGRYAISVTTGDTATEIGDKLETLINADLDANVSASNTDGTVTITAKNSGTNGNTILLETDGTVAGITTTIASPFLSGGANDPDISNLFDVVVNENKVYTYIVFPSTYATASLISFTDARFDSTLNDRMYGVQCKNDTYANLNTTLDGLNSKTYSLICNKLTTDGFAGIRLNPDFISSYIVGILSLLITEGSNVANYVTNGQNIGANYWAAYPYFNLLLQDFPIIPSDRQFSTTEVNELFNSGGVVLKNNKSKTTVLTHDFKTTYKTDGSGNPDNSFAFLNYYLCAVKSVEYIVNNLENDYSQYALTDSKDIPPNRAITNIEGVISKMELYYDILSGSQYLLLRGGAENKNLFINSLKQNNLVNLSTNSITFSNIELPITSQIRSITMSFNIQLNNNNS